MGWCGCKVTGRENRTHTRGKRKHVIYKFMSRLCILTSTESYLKLPLHVLSLFHAHIQTFFHSLLFFFFSFSFLNSREQSIRWPREKIRSNCHNIVIIRELFNKHRQMFFRCSVRIFVLFCFFVSIQRIYIGLLLSFGNVSTKAFVFRGDDSRDSCGDRRKRGVEGKFFYVTFDLVLNEELGHSIERYTKELAMIKLPFN